MGVREALNKSSKTMPIAAAAVMILVSAGFLIAYFRPEKKANLAQTFFSDDDGKTWFVASAFAVPPFEHNGKTAVQALVYSYDGGSKRFCAYLVKYTDDAKKKLDAAFDEARSKGQPPGSVALLRDVGFKNAGLMAKLPGANNPWVPWTDPRTDQIFSIRSPDGSAVDQCFVY